MADDHNRRAKRAKPLPPPAQGLPWTPAEIRRLRGALARWFLGRRRDLPWRSGRTPYSCAVSEIMLQQTQAAKVAPYFLRWMAAFPNWSALAAADGEEVHKMWEGLGYYRRARMLHAAARAVVGEWGGELPADFGALLSLPGFGRYTAGAVASMAFGLRHPAVDGNATRVLGRLAGLSRENVSEIEACAGGLVPAKNPGLFNEALIELGALVCRPAAPACGECPWLPFCQTPHPRRADAKKTAAPKMVEVLLRVAWCVRAGRVALRMSDGPWWRGLWVLPGCGGGRLLHEERCSVTRHRVTIQIFAGRVAPGAPGVRWVAAGELGEVPMPAPFRRAVGRLASSLAAAETRAVEPIFLHTAAGLPPECAP